MNEDEVRTLVEYRLGEARAALADARYVRDGQRSAQSIVNRLYYAMFYATLALMQKIGQVPSKRTGVLALFDREYVLKGVFSREMSRHQHRAFELRQVSDYRVMPPMAQDEMDELFRQANAFVENVTEHLQQC